MMSRKTEQASIAHLKPESDPSYLYVQYSSHRGKHPIGDMEVKPNGQNHLSLGRFRRSQPPKGFSIHIMPEPQDRDAIVTQITSHNVDHNDQFELVLHAANYDAKTVGIEVHKIVE